MRPILFAAIFLLMAAQLLPPVFASERNSLSVSVAAPQKGSVSTASAQETQASKYVTIPIYYLTDRDLHGETYGRHRRYLFNCRHHMYYGTLYFTVPNKAKKSDRALFQRLGWQSTDEKPKKYSPKDRIDPADPAAAKAAFLKRIGTALDNSGKDKLCVFVHGALDTFESAAEDAAMLAYYLERPMVFYSWPSDAKFFGYVIDEGNSEWSQQHFNTFAKDMLQFRKNHPMKMTMIAHSMGNRLLIRGLPAFYGSGLVEDWELISPDIDADTCRHYVMGYREKAHIRLYVSNRDKMLPFSQMLFGGYFRLGEDVTLNALQSKKPSTSASDTDAKTDSKTDAKTDSQSDSRPDSQSDSLVEATANKETGSSSGDSNSDSDSADSPSRTASGEVKDFWLQHIDPDLFERIDFTAIDHGYSGHSIPYRLVANMVDTGEPGPGLELVQAAYVRLNRLTRFMARGLHAKQKNIHRPLYCKEVIRVPAKKR